MRPQPTNCGIISSRNDPRARFQGVVTTPRVRVRDIDVNYEIPGSGPRLLYIGGSGGDPRGLGQTRTPSGPYTMGDYAEDADALLEPAAENLERTLSVLAGLGYSLEAGGEPFLDLADSLVLRRVIENGASLSAIHPDASELDRLTSISGFGYADLLDDAATFEVPGARVHFGRLEKLLRSEELSGRPKDLEFL